MFARNGVEGRCFPQDDVFAEGFITGLRPGSNVLSAGPRSTGQILAKILVFNYPRSGPIFSGPHQTPFVCETDFQGLGPPLDPDCSAPTRVDYYYRSTTRTASSRSIRRGRVRPTSP